MMREMFCRSSWIRCSWTVNSPIGRPSGVTPSPLGSRAVKFLVRSRPGSLWRKKLRIGLHHRDRLQRVHLHRAGPQERRLASTADAADDDRLLGPDGRAEELIHRGRHHAAGAEFLQGDAGEAVLADDDGRPVGDEGLGVETETILQVQGHDRVGRGERLRGLAVGGDELQLLDQLSIGVGDRRHLDDPVGVDHEHAVVAEDLDVLHVGVFEQRLPAPVPEDRRVNSPGVALKVDGGDLVVAIAGQDGLVGVLLDDMGDQVAADLNTGRLVDLTVCQLLPGLIGQPLRDGVANPVDQRPVEVGEVERSHSGRRQPWLPPRRLLPGQLPEDRSWR